MQKTIREEDYTNYEMCKVCGGRCCLNGGCQYLPSDFEKVKFDFLLSKLEEGYISIVSFMRFSDAPQGTDIKIKLYVKARNVGRPVIDLLSMRTSCSALENSFCRYSFEERPSGGKFLIPHPELGYCLPAKAPDEYISSWSGHQNVLRKLVKHYTGKTVEEKIREDVYTLFRDLLARNFEGVGDMEKRIMLDGMPTLADAFPEEYLQAKADHLSAFPDDPLFSERGR